MLCFFNVPTNAPIGVGSNTSSFEQACIDIEAKWKPFFKKSKPEKPLGKTAITIGTLGNSLSRLNVDGMPLDRCHLFVQLYLQGSSFPAANTISARPWMGGLSPDHRRCADEMLACTLSLDVSSSLGYKFIGHRNDVNKQLEIFGTDAWTYIWQDKGPDYLLAGNGHFAFLESKGDASDVKRTPSNFARYKAQSLNAELSLGHGAGIVALSARHILSYVYLPAGGVGTSPVPASVQWFNTAPGGSGDGNTDPQPGSGIMTAAVALAEFSLVCRNQGVDYLDVLNIEGRTSTSHWPGVRAIADHHMPFLLLSNSGFGPAFAIATRCVKIILKLHKLLQNEALAIPSAELRITIPILDKVAFGLLKMLEEAAVLSDADKDTLQRSGINLRFGATQQMFATGLFTVSIPR